MAVGLLFNNAKYSFISPYTEEESIASKGCLFSFSLFAVTQLYWVFSKDLLFPHKARGSADSCKEVIRWMLLGMVSSHSQGRAPPVLWGSSLTTCSLRIFSDDSLAG